jgi:hypothetical protein
VATSAYMNNTGEQNRIENKGGRNLATLTPIPIMFLFCHISNNITSFIKREDYDFYVC